MNLLPGQSPKAQISPMAWVAFLGLLQKEFGGKAANFSRLCKKI
jgi:hypothetical protein